MKIYKKDITVKMCYPHATYALSMRIKDDLIKVQYQGYTLREAKKQFFNACKKYIEDEKIK